MLITTTIVVKGTRYYRAKLEFEKGELHEGMLTGIIFGWKMSDDNKKLIKAWNSLRGSPLKIYQPEPSTDSFEMVITSENGERL